MIDAQISHVSVMVGSTGATNIFEQFQDSMFGNPVILQVAFTEVPSTRAAITVLRLSVLSRFMIEKTIMLAKQECKQYFSKHLTCMLE
jgi:hypothetical protein